MSEEQLQTSVGSKGVPNWATAPLSAYLDDVEQLERLLHLSMRGISMVRAAPKAFDALALVEPERYASEDAKARRENVGEYARLAQEEVDRGFPLLHAQSVISLWTGLECALRNLAAAWFRHRPEAYQLDAVKRIHIRLGEYESLNLDERGYHIVELIEQEVSASLKPGVGRFEAVLETISLSGGVPDAVRKILFELSQVRNLLVHRRGVVDRRIVDQCPWLNLVVGEIVIVTHEQFRRYHDASVAYIMELIQRLRLFFGNEPDPNLVQSISEIESGLAGA